MDKENEFHIQNGNGCIFTVGWNWSVVGKYSRRYNCICSPIVCHIYFADTKENDAI